MRIIFDDVGEYHRPELTKAEEETLVAALDVMVALQELMMEHNLTDGEVINQICDGIDGIEDALGYAIEDEE
jgi:hypothetical protein